MAVLRVINSFALLSDGRIFAAGALVDSTDPVVKGREAYFEAVEANVARPRVTSTPLVEAATAAPGEKRARGHATVRAPSAP